MLWCKFRVFYVGISFYELLDLSIRFYLMLEILFKRCWLLVVFIYIIPWKKDSFYGNLLVDVGVQTVNDLTPWWAQGWG